MFCRTYIGIMVAMNSESGNGAATNLVRLLAPTLPVVRASLEQLQQRVKSTIQMESQIAAIRAEALAELHRREGTEIAESVLREDGLLARRRARVEVETAQELEDLPATRQELRKGEISYDNARIIASASQSGEIDEKGLAEIAKTQTPEKFAATVRKHEQARSEDDGMAKLEFQRSQRFAKIKTDLDDGMTVLYGRFDPITGAQIETVLSRKVGELWREEDANNRATAGQRMADALGALITQSGQDQEGRPVGARLLLIADYDTVSGQLKDVRLSDETPVPAEELRRLACDAQILPAIFRGRSQPLDLGMARRIASPAQRTALVARDRRCVGCGAKSAWCQAHHVVHWMDGGPTDLENMCLLCTRCHHKVHDDGWKVQRTPTGRFFLRRPPKHYGRPARRRRSHRPRRRPIRQRK